MICVNLLPERISPQELIMSEKTCNHREVNKLWPQTLRCNSKWRSCDYPTGEMVPIAQPERENHSGITSAVRFELLSRGTSVYSFPFNGESPTRESSFGFSARSASRLKTFTHISRHSSETPLPASVIDQKYHSRFGFRVPLRCRSRVLDTAEACSTRITYSTSPR
jgi:hypothetical protein